MMPDESPYDGRVGAVDRVVLVVDDLDRGHRAERLHAVQVGAGGNVGDQGGLDSTVRYAAPPVSTRAPLATAASTRRCTISSAAGLMSGPMIVSISLGSPTLRPAVLRGECVDERVGDGTLDDDPAR